MKVEGVDVNEDRVIGFIKIVEKGEAQQVTVSTKLLARVTKFLVELEKMGFEKVVITVQKGCPLVIGGKEIGIGIAPVVEDE